MAPVRRSSESELSESSKCGRIHTHGTGHVALEGHLLLAPTLRKNRKNPRHDSANRLMYDILICRAVVCGIHIVVMVLSIIVIIKKGHN